MIVRIEIRFLALPVIGDSFTFTINVDGVPVVFNSGQDSVLINLQGFDSAPWGVQIKPTLAETITHTRNNMLLFFNAAGINYEIRENSIFIYVNREGEISITDIEDTPGRVILFFNDASSLPDFTVGEFEIEVIDTYENERILIDEITQAGVPKLTWDGGDDLYSPLMTSKLTFNILVPSGNDGQFLHLLSGDERRFLVKVNNYDADENKTLIWQGYILPDLYSEPYVKGGLFVEFTAVDMLASLKGKYFDPWYYSSKIELPYLLGFILRETGLEQEMWVRPSLVNVTLGESWLWRRMNLGLSQFADGEKYTNLYEILESVLKSQGLLLYSYRGNWFLDGLTRRGEMSGEVEIYYPDGEYKENLLLAAPIVTTQFLADPPMITAETPFKKVNAQFSSDSDSNLFSSEIIQRDYYSTKYDYAENKHNIEDGYLNQMMNSWFKFGADLIRLGGKELPYLYYARNTAFSSASYNMPESSALVNYIECYTKPYAVAGRLYELEFDVEMTLSLTDVQPSDQWISEQLKAGQWDRVLSFQMFLNGNEFLSNRPGFITGSLIKFEKEVTGTTLGAFSASFKLKWEFEVPESGQITFRILPPLDHLNSYGLLMFWIYPKNLKINVVGDIEDLESVSAVRPLRSTKELNYDVDITCTVDTAVKNSFGYGNMVAVRFAEIPVGTQSEFTHDHTFAYNNLDIPVHLNFSRWQISEFFQDIIFRGRGLKSVFLIKEDGAKIPYSSLYSKTIEGLHYMAAYLGYDAPMGGRPKIPPGYKPLPEIGENDTLMMMMSLYGVENNLNRALWKIYGFDDATAATYLQTLAHACHAVRPTTIYQIETVALQLVFPRSLVAFKYDGVRLYIPTRLQLNLDSGKTGLTMTEARLNPVTDITYE